jgi:hypothetical protein
MKFIVCAVMVTFVLNASAIDPMAYPKMPDLSLTPGSLCDHPDSYRHPEQIPYCERAVNSFAKEAVFIAYKNIGFRLNSDRANFKVDHFIPLCAGGSNNMDNLWPQHHTLSTITDQIESMGCEKLSKGKILQKDLVDLVTRAKLNLEDAPKILKQLRSLR